MLARKKDAKKNIVRCHQTRNDDSGAERRSQDRPFVFAGGETSGRLSYQ